MNFLAADSTLITSIITPLAVCILVPLSMTAVNAWHRKVAEKQSKKLDPSSFKVKHNALVIGMMIFLVIFLLLAALVFPIIYLCDIPDGPPIEVAIGTGVGFGGVAIICGVFLYVLKRCEIGVSEEGIKYVPYFSKCKEYSWQDLDYVKVINAYGNLYYKVYVKQRKKAAFSFSSALVGGAQLANTLKTKGFISGFNFL